MVVLNASMELSYLPPLLCSEIWEDAVYTSNYIHNRIPHKGINNQVPFEILYNNKVD